MSADWRPKIFSPKRPLPSLIATWHCPLRGFSATNGLQTITFKAKRPSSGRRGRRARNIPPPPHLLAEIQRDLPVIQMVPFLHDRGEGIGRKWISSSNGYQSECSDDCLGWPILTATGLQMRRMSEEAHLATAFDAQCQSDGITSGR